VAPDCDQEIHRYQHEFPEQIEKEQIDREEYAGDTGQHPHQIKVEETRVSADLGPRGEHGHDAQEKGQQKKHEAEPIQRQMEANSQLWNPIQVQLFRPARRRISRHVPRAA
jgi:hypothetical protein